MQKIFFQNLLFLFLLNVLIKPLWILGIDRTVQNVVGTSSYGIYFVLFNLTMLTQILLDVGISNYNNRHLAQNEGELKSYLSNIFSIKILLTLFFFIITFVIAFLIHYTRYQLYLLGIICLNQALASLIIYLRSNISALHHFKVDSMLSVLDKTLMILICGGLLVIPSFRTQFTIESFIYSQTIAYFITLTIALGYIISVSGTFRFRFSSLFARSLLKKSFPFALLILLMAIYSRIDGVMIQKLLPETGTHEAGIYASAYRLLDALNQFGFLFAVLLLPIFSRMLAKHENIATLARASFTVIFIFSFIICVITSSFSIPIMSLLYHDASPYSSKILSVIIYSFLGTATVYIFGTLLTANGNLKELILVSLLAVILNFSMNFYLIKSEGAYGAAFTAAITNIVIGALNLFVSVKVFHFRINYWLLIRLLLFSVLCILIFYTQSWLHVNWMIEIIVYATACLMIAFLLGLLEIKKIISILKPEVIT